MGPQAYGGGLVNQGHLLQRLGQSIVYGPLRLIKQIKTLSYKRKQD